MICEVGEGCKYWGEDKGMEDEDDEEDDEPTSCLDVKKNTTRMKIRWNKTCPSRVLDEDKMKRDEGIMWIYMMIVHRMMKDEYNYW